MYRIQLTSEQSLVRDGDDVLIRWGLDVVRRISDPACLVVAS